MSASMPMALRPIFRARHSTKPSAVRAAPWRYASKAIIRFWTLVLAACVFACAVPGAHAQQDGPANWTAPFPPPGAVADPKDPSTATVTEAMYIDANQALQVGPPPEEGANILWRRVDTYRFDCSQQVWKAIGVQWFGKPDGTPANASGVPLPGPPHGMEDYAIADQPPGPPPGSQLDPSDPSLARNPTTGTTYMRGKDRWVESKTGKVLGAPQICTNAGIAYAAPPEAPEQAVESKHDKTGKEPGPKRISESWPPVVGIELGFGLAKYSDVNDCSSWSAVYPKNSCSSTQSPSTYRFGGNAQMGQFQVSAGYSFSGEVTRTASAPLIGGVQGENSTFKAQFGYLLGGFRFPSVLEIEPYVDLGVAFWRATLNADQSVTNALGVTSASSSQTVSGASVAFGAGLQYQFTSNFSIKLDYLHYQASKSPALAAQANLLTLDLIVNPFESSDQ